MPVVRGKSGNGAPKPGPRQRQKQQKQQKIKRKNNNGGSMQSSFVPTGISSVVRPGAPAYSGRAASSDASIVVTHREFFTDITSTASSAFFLYVNFYIQPGRPEIFPWLHQMARLYESYEVLDLSFHYVPRCPSTTAGYVAMGIDYDAKDSPPTTKTSLLSYHGAVSASPWQPCTLKCDQRDLHKLGRDFFVRSSLANNTTGDLKTYDVGSIYLATGGNGSSAIDLGEIYVDYRIRFNTPQLNISAATKANSKIVHPSAGVSAAAPLGSAQTIAGGLPLRVLDGTQFVLPDVGQYIIQAFATGTGLATGDVTLAATAAGDFVSTANDIANGAGTLESITWLVNNVNPSSLSNLYVLSAAGATTLSDLVLRIGSYSPTSNQPAGGFKEVEGPHED